MGAVFGGVSLVTIFNTVIDCIDRVKIGKQFGHDQRSYHQELAILKLRLTRWRRAVVDLSQAREWPLNDQEEELARQTLDNIIYIFDSLQEKTKRFGGNASQAKTTTTSSQETVIEPTDSQVINLDDLMRTHNDNDMINKMNKLSLETDGGTGVDGTRIRRRDQMKWALGKKQDFTNLMAEAKELVDQLETIIPLEAMKRRLEELTTKDAKALVARNTDRGDVDYLLQIASMIDEKFADLIGRAAEGHVFLRNSASGNSHMRMGDEMNPDWDVATYGLPGGRHHYEGNVSSGNARVSMGNTYGSSNFHMFNQLHRNIGQAPIRVSGGSHGRVFRGGLPRTNAREPGLPRHSTWQGP